MLTMAGRSALSPDWAPPASELPSAPSAPLADCCIASRCTGSPFGLVIVPGVPGAKFSPVITPPVLTVTSAVACCHHGRGFLAGCTDISSPPRSVRRWLLLPGLGKVAQDRLHPRVTGVAGVVVQHGRVARLPGGGAYH